MHAAPAALALAVDGHVSELRRDAVRATQELAVQHDRGTDARAHRDDDQREIVRRAERGPFAEPGAVGVVVEGDRDVERASEARGQGEVVPTGQDHGAAYDARVGVDQACEADAGGADRTVVTDQVSGERRGSREHSFGAVPARGRDGPSGENAPLAVDDDCEDLRPAEVDTEPARSHAL